MRAATPADASAIASVHVESWQAAYRGQLPDDVLDNLSVDQRAEMWSVVMASTRPADAVLLLERAGILEGFAHVCEARDADAGHDTGEVSSLYLRPEDWGHGLGRELMAAALSHLAEAGSTSAILWVLATNGRARRFYDAGCWELDGAERTEHIGGAQVSEVRYRRELGAMG